MMTSQPTKSIAVLGFSTPCSLYNEDSAYEIGRILSDHGYAVTAGNITSTFYYAFKGAKSNNGKTLAILEKDFELQNKFYCDAIERVTTVDDKHTKIADSCIGAIVIGGGNGTKHVVNKFLQRNKPVIAIKYSGGIVESELDEQISCVSNIKESLVLFH